MPDDCIFCKMAANAIPVERVWENDEFFAIADIHPQAPTHLLVIPKAHVAKLTDVTDAAFLGRTLAAVVETARAAGLADTGFRTVINCGVVAGQRVFHLHLHVLGGREME
jgi:histidine triad (HIT) family protein